MQCKWYNAGLRWGLPPQIGWILSRQAALVGLLGIVAWVLYGGNAAASVLAGGACGVVANGAYAWHAFVRRDAASAGNGAAARAYRAQMAGEATKFAVTAVLFALVFSVFRNVAALPLFLGYASTFVIYWVSLLRR